MAARVFPNISVEPTAEAPVSGTPGHGNQAILRTEADIAALMIVARRFFSRLDFREVVVSIDGLEAGAANNIQVRINDYLRECGCYAGSIIGACGILIYLSLLIAIAGGPSAWRWKHLLYGILFCFAAAMIGKGFGLLRARVRFVHTLQSLQNICPKGDASSGG